MVGAEERMQGRDRAMSHPQWSTEDQSALLRLPPRLQAIYAPSRFRPDGWWTECQRWPTITLCRGCGGGWAMAGAGSCCICGASTVWRLSASPESLMKIAGLRHEGQCALCAEMPLRDPPATPGPCPTCAAAQNRQGPGL